MLDMPPQVIVYQKNRKTVSELIKVALRLFDNHYQAVKRISIQRKFLSMHYKYASRLFRH